METKERRKERKEESGVHSTPDYLDAFQFVRSFCHIWVGYINIGRTAFVRPIISATHFKHRLELWLRIRTMRYSAFQDVVSFPSALLKVKKKKKIHFLLARLDGQEPEPLLYTHSIYQTSKH